MHKSKGVAIFVAIGMTTIATINEKEKWQEREKLN